MIEILFKQWIFEIEDGAFLEDGLRHEVVARRYRNVSWRKYVGCSGKRHFNICRMHVCVCIRMKTSRSKSVALGHSLRSFTYYVQAVAVLRRNHAPEAGRGDDETTGNAQHTSNTINAPR